MNKCYVCRDNAWYISLNLEGNSMTKNVIHIFTLIILALTSTACIYSPSPEELKKIDALESELELLKEEIKTTENENSSLVGGLIKVLIEARLETLKGTEALIQQRIHALESGAKISLITPGSNPDTELVSELQKQIDIELAELTGLETEAAGYAGGLILAMKKASIATQEQTIAMLRQRYLGAKYGLPVAINCSQNYNDRNKNTGSGLIPPGGTAESSRQTIPLPKDDDSRL